jgi:type IV pilus assembly protein PilN
MRITLNLASKPWVDTGTLVRRLRIALGALAVACILLLVGLHFEARAAQIAQAKRDAMDAQQAKLEREKRQFEFDLEQPQNAAVLERSQYLNQVFAEKSFSWTAVMMDLENVMPAGVQVASIEPQVMPGGDIVIRLRVNGDRDRAVDLVRNLEKSKRFLAPRLASEASEAPTGAAQQVAFQANGPAGVTFEILADYNPVPTAPAAAAKTDATPGGKTVLHGSPVMKAAPKKSSGPVNTTPGPASGLGRPKSKGSLQMGTAIHARTGH